MADDKTGEQPIEEMAISKFKATCLAVMEKVRATGRPVLVTRFGTPVAKVVPPEPPARPDNWLGDMRATARIRGDLVAPVGDLEEWDAWRE